MTIICVIISSIILIIALIIKIIYNIKDKQKEEELSKRDDYSIINAASRYKHKHK